jgi:hypothetical protein
MISFYRLKDYPFLEVLKEKFSNPKKVIKDGHVILEIDSDEYHKTMDEHYDGYIDILNDIKEYTGKDFYFQQYPNFRFNTPDDIYPVWHSDRHFNHHPEEINVMIPITKKDFGFEVIGNISKLFVYLPFKLLNTKLFKFIFNKLSTKINDLDKILIFDGFHLHTASNRKQFGNTRISIDFRLLPVEHKKEYKKSHRGIPIKPGYYFSEKTISEYIKNK